MKGAIGNAFIMNMVITFIAIFFSLLIGSMAFSKAHKIKNYIVNEIDIFEKRRIMYFDSSYETEELREWNETVNSFLSKTGYHLAKDNSSCPDSTDKNISRVIWSDTGRYDYCIYRVGEIYDSPESDIRRRYHYQVKVFMKMDLPVIGEMIKIPIVSETQSYTEFKWEEI